MNKYNMWIVGIFSPLVVSLAGCGLSPINDGTQVSTSKQLTLVTTFAPLYAHTKSIVQDQMEVTNLVEIGKSVYGRQLTPQKAVDLEKADAVIINGLELEDFLESAIAELGEKIVDTSHGVDLIAFQGKSHEHEHEAEVHEDHEVDHYQRQRDPHVWLDPDNAIIQTNNILASLQKIDPTHYASYAKNAEDYSTKIKTLDNQIKEKFAATKFKNFIVFHNAYAYFLDHYGLKQYQKSVIQDFEGEVSSLEDIQTFIQQIEQEDVKVIFTEPQFSPKIVTMLKEEKPELIIQQINPIGDSLSVDTYINNLQALADNMIQAMSQI